MSRLLDMEISFKIKINDYPLFSKILNGDNDFFKDDRYDFLLYVTEIKTLSNGFEINIYAQLANIFGTLTKFLKMLEPFIVSNGEIGKTDCGDIIHKIYMNDGKIEYFVI